MSALLDLRNCPRFQGISCREVIDYLWMVEVRRHTETLIGQGTPKQYNK